jgi:transposase
MIFPEDQLQIWLYRAAVDMRKSFDGLAQLVKHQLHENPAAGQLFVFINRKRSYIKILYFDRGGYCLWAKRLEQGLFAQPDAEGIKQKLDWMGLKLLLEGIEINTIKRRKRYRKKAN